MTTLKLEMLNLFPHKKAMQVAQQLLNDNELGQPVRYAPTGEVEYRVGSFIIRAIRRRVTDVSYT